MNENPEAMPEDAIPMTAKDREDLASIGVAAEEPTHSVLKSWVEVLSNAEKFLGKPVSLEDCIKVVRNWTNIRMQEVQEYSDQYHRVLMDAHKLVVEIVRENPEALAFVGEEDMRENFPLYKALIVGWNLQLNKRNSEWVSTAKNSHVQAAALIDARGYLFANGMGLTAHLDALGFEFSAEEFSKAYAEAKEEAGV